MKSLSRIKDRALKGFNLALLMTAATIGHLGHAKAQTNGEPTVVTNVDLERYMGTWFEVGHLPNFFQKLCERSIAEYSLNEDGTVNVFNTCVRNEKVLTTISGTASVVNPAEPAKLIVDFGFLRKGDYWIIDLDKNYQWAVVSGPDKESLFILSRTIPMSDKTLKRILKKLDKQGIDTSKIIYDIYE